MHNYSFDNDYRKTATIVIIITSLLISELLYTQFENFIIWASSKSNKLSDIVLLLEKYGIGINLFTVLCVFGFLYWLYSKHLWKCKPIRLLHKIPDLSGEWSGYLISSFKDEDGNDTIIDATFIIVQDWNKISIQAEFDKSSSYSETASLYINSPDGVRLTFTYINNFKDVNAKSKKYDGCNILNFNNSRNVNGYYFTNREDGTHGIIYLNKSVSK